MGSPKKNQSKGLFAAMTSGLSMFGNAMHRSVNGYLHFIVILFNYNTIYIYIYIYLHIYNSSLFRFVCVVSVLLRFVSYIDKV
jgi:type IV secretory pathway VirB3-like protein